MTKKNKGKKKDFFCLLDSTRITPCSYVSPFIIEKKKQFVRRC